MQELERDDSGVRSFERAVRSRDVSESMLSVVRISEAIGYLFCIVATKFGCFGLTEPDFGSNPGGIARSRKRLVMARPAED